MQALKEAQQREYQRALEQHPQYQQLPHHPSQAQQPQLQQEQLQQQQLQQQQLQLEQRQQQLQQQQEQLLQEQRQAQSYYQQQQERHQQLLQQQQQYYLQQTLQQQQKQQQQQQQQQQLQQLRQLQQSQYPRSQEQPRRHLPPSILNPGSSGSGAAQHFQRSASYVYDPTAQSAAMPMRPPIPPMAMARPYEQLSQLTFTLTNLREFSIRASPGRVNDLLLPLLQSIEGFAFDSKKQRVIFPLSQHQKVIISLRGELKDQVFEQLDSSVVTAAQIRMEKELRQTDEEVAAADKKIHRTLLKWKVPSPVLDALAPFQKEAVYFACNLETNAGRALIADEMGLGKTRSAIGCMCAFKQNWPVLVVCPSSARYHWRSELLNDVTLIEGKSHPLGTTARHRLYKVVIVSYGLVDTMYDQLSSYDFDMVVLDESHYLKNPKAKRTKALRPIARKATRCIMLSGTPALSRPMELFSQLNILSQARWPDVKEFGKRYCRVKKVKKNSKFSGASNTHELHLILTDTLMIRRLKKNILKNLPQKRRSIVPVELSDADNQELGALLQEVRLAEEAARNENQEVDEAELKKHRMTALMSLFTKSGVAKLPKIIDKLEEFLLKKSNGKVLVFGHHLAVLRGLSAFLDANLHDYIRIDGGTPPADRANLINQFQTNPSIRVAVLGINAAGQGITLTAASTIQYFYAANTVDELLWPLIKEKMKALGEVVEGKATDLSLANKNSSSKLKSKAEIFKDDDQDDDTDTDSALGESDDEEPEPCPLARQYMDQLRVEKRKRKFDRLLKAAAAPPYVPADERSSESILPEDQNTDELLSAIPGSSPPAEKAPAAQVELPPQRDRSNQEVILLEDTDTE
eukprot:GSChrysophyteH1.ASY1.ANO1.699.1 assembled CDS